MKLRSPQFALVLLLAGSLAVPQPSFSRHPVGEFYDFYPYSAQAPELEMLSRNLPRDLGLDLPGSCYRPGSKRDLSKLGSPVAFAHKRRAGRALKAALEKDDLADIYELFTDLAVKTP